VQGGRRLQDPAAVAPGQAGVVGDQGGRHVAHDDHPTVGDPLGPEDGVVDDGRHPGQDARRPQLGGAAVVVAGPHDPVAPVADVLDDQDLPAGQDDPFQQASGPAVGGGQRLPGDHVGQQRRRLGHRTPPQPSSGLGFFMYHSRYSVQRPSASKRSRNRLSYSSRTVPLVLK
jgi:hypothetical protein